MYRNLLQHHTTTVLRPFFRDHPGEPVPGENFWTLWCKRRLTEADTTTILLGAIPSGLTSAHLHHPPYYLQVGCPSCHPTNSIKALKATILLLLLLLLQVIKTGQSNLTTGHIAATHGRFNGIHQMAPVCTPPNNDSLGPSKSTIQTASPLVQPSTNTDNTAYGSVIRHAWACPFP